MFLKCQKTLIVLGALLVACLLAWGCASRSYVKTRTQELEDMNKANKAQIDDLQQKLSATDAKADDALSTARNALKKAEEAAGYVGYTEFKAIGEREVNFDFDRYNLGKIGKDILDEIGTAMQQHPELILEIEGHTDVIGSDDYNLALGRKRAESVERYLADKFGIALHRMFYISYGKSKPKELADTKTGQAAQRRAVLRLLGPKTQEAGS
ncbi:MAG: OmpA family protein [Candidatus Zixiibacteriota bacterium]